MRGKSANAVGEYHFWGIMIGSILLAAAGILLVP